MYGFDLGSMNTSIAYCINNTGAKFFSDVILSETSARTIPTVIAYTKSHRTIGEHAMMGIRKHINTTFMYLNRLLGMRNDTIYAREELCYNLTSYESIISPDETTLGDVLYRLNFLKENSDGVNTVKLGDNSQSDYFPVECLIAGFINKIKQDFLSGKDLISFTFAVPDYFTIKQRDSLSRAIKICAIDNFNIINESTAITLYYGFNRYKDLFMESPTVNSTNTQIRPDSSKIVVNPNTCKYIMFIDFGHSSTSLILAEFRPTNFRVVNSVSHPFLGGRNIDKILYDHLIKIFCNKYKIDPTKKAFSLGNKTSIRLIEQITKAKRILSSNQETSINVDAFYDDYDINCIITRKEFEAIIQPVLTMFSSILEDFYKKSFNMIDKQMTAIEMAGESMRIPIIGQIVKNITGKDLSRTVIVDECVSKGSSFFSALTSGILPIIGFNTVLSYNYYVIYYSIHSETTGLHIKELLINRAETVPVMKSLVLDPAVVNKNRYATDLKVTLFYILEDTVYFNDNKNIISQYEFNLKEILAVNHITNLDKNSLININFYLDDSSKPTYHSISMNNKTLNINYDNLVKTHAHHEFLIPSQEIDKNFVNYYAEIESAHLKQDENYKNYYKIKNQLESNVYKIKNKYYEKQSEYDKLKCEGHVSDKRPILTRLDSVEMALTGDSHELDYAILERASHKLKDIERILNESESKKLDQSQDIQNITKTFRDKINFYSNLIDKEYVKHLQGEKSNLDVTVINRVSDILHKYGLLMNKSRDGKELENYMNEMEKEIKIYVK